MPEATQRFEVISIKHLAGLVVLQTLDGESVQAPLESGQQVALASADRAEEASAVVALRRLEEACDKRAELTTPEAYNALVALPGMKDALYELDDARKGACAVLKAASHVLDAKAPSARPNVVDAARRVLAASAKAVEGCPVPRWAGQENGNGEEFGVELDAALSELRNVVGGTGTVTLADGTVLREGEHYERTAPPAAPKRVVGYLTERGQFYGSLTAMPKHEHATARPLTFAHGMTA